MCILDCGLSFMLILQTFAQAEARHWESMKDEWEREKQRLLNTILGSQQEATIDFSLDQSTVVK